MNRHPKEDFTLTEHGLTEHGLTHALLTVLASMTAQIPDVSGALTAMAGSRSLLREAAASDFLTALIRQSPELDLATSDIVAVCVADMAERSPVVTNAIRAVQGQDSGPWPSTALVARMCHQLGAEQNGDLFAAQRAIDLGILTTEQADVPYPERRLMLSPIACHALGIPGKPGLKPRPVVPPDATESWFIAAAGLAEQTGERQATIVLREGDTADRIGFAAMIGAALGLQPMQIPDGAADGLGCIATLAGWFPIENLTAGPVRRNDLVDLGPHPCHRAVITDRQTAVRPANGVVIDGAFPDIGSEERRALWDHALSPMKLSDGTVPLSYGPARIATIAGRVRVGSGAVGPRLRKAMGADLEPDLEPLATLVPRDVPDDAFVVEQAVRQDFELLLARCRHRNGTGLPMGATGVRALLSGPSGTGKTHACGWLATALGLPLFKVDLSSIVSKYIGETEENLARLLDQAESVDAVILMDEADSLFGARTQASDGTDRYANNQTNFLLSRIETFDGIAILTTNGRERIDSAFARRLDQIIEVPLPAARERREILRLHLPADHALDGGDLNRIATHVDLAGGHLRNIVQTAQIAARAAGRRLSIQDIRTGIVQEFRKIGRTPPSGLKR